MAIHSEAVPALSAGGLLARTQVRLVSTGTESICYRGEKDDESHWHNWVQYPFCLGYSNVAKVETISNGFAGFEISNRISSRSPHHQLLMVDADEAVRVPDNISDDGVKDTRCLRQLG